MTTIRSKVQNVERLSHRTLDDIVGKRNPLWKETGSSVTRRLDLLYGVPIGNFDLSDVAFLIRQDVGVPLVIGRALTALEKEPFVCTQYYEGDVLAAVLELPTQFWAEWPDFKKRLLDIADNVISAPPPAEDSSVTAEIIESVEHFWLTNR